MRRHTPCLVVIAGLLAFAIPGPNDLLHVSRDLLPNWQAAETAAPFTPWPGRPPTVVAAAPPAATSTSPFGGSGPVLVPAPNDRDNRRPEPDHDPERQRRFPQQAAVLQATALEQWERQRRVSEAAGQPVSEADRLRQAEPVRNAWSFFNRRAEPC